MNLNELFNKQVELDSKIIEKHNLYGVDLVKKKTVAMICELYEATNLARFFKFWSENQKATTIVVCDLCKDEGVITATVPIKETEIKVVCPLCGGVKSDENPLLTEYVDVVHFALSIANDLEYTSHDYVDPGTMDLNDLVIGTTNLMTLIPEVRSKKHISTLFNLLIKFGYQLGFKENDVIDYYMEKNKINHERQESGY